MKKFVAADKGEANKFQQKLVEKLAKSCKTTDLAPTVKKRVQII